MSACRSNDRAAFGRRFRILAPLLAVLVAACSGPTASGDVPDLGNAEISRIGEIQGRASRSGWVERRVSVPGVITGNFVDGLGGFYMQDESGAEDGDPLTSDAIFVRWSPQDSPAVRRGERVRVDATVAELGDGSHTQTALIDARIEVLGRAAVQSTAIEGSPDDDDWERYEGMWLRVVKPLTVAGNFGLDRFGELEVSFDRRPRAIGARMDPAAAKAAARSRHTAARLLMLDDNRRGEYPDRLWFLPEPPSAERPLRAGSVLHGVEGILQLDGPGQRLQLTAAVATIEQAERPPPPQVDAGDGLRVGHFNVLNLFNGDGRGGGFPTERGARTAEELQRQQAKLIAMILALAPDVASLVELENDGRGPHSAQQQLVDALNATLGEAGDYRGVEVPAEPGDDVIRVGLIYRAGKVELLGPAAQLTSGPFADRARPPLAQTFRSVAGGPAFTVVSVHLKSKSGCEQIPADRPDERDQGDGQGCWTPTRTASAQELATWMRSDPTASGTRLALLLGDFNANTFEPPMQELRDAGWIDAIDPDDKNGHTYIYRGLGNRLDHAMLSPALTKHKAFAAIWHANADEAPLFGYANALGSLPPPADAYRSSDHDPLLLVLSLAPH